MCLSSILRWILNALVLMIITMIIPGISVQSFFAALIAVLILSLINATIRPLMLILTLPVNILTLGLFTLIINALMFYLTASIVKGFNIDNFWSAFFGALIYTLISITISSFTDSGQGQAKIDVK